MEGSKAVTYGTDYYGWQKAEASASARVLLPLVLDLVSPTSVLDVGCGTGVWLRVVMEHGVDDVLGVDGGTGELAIPAEKFRRVDLERPLDLGRRFDLVICMEVAEHLSPGRASSLVDDLCRAADVILFSAAIPGQGRPGSGEHPNERWQSYWAALFNDRGYDTFDAIRPTIWDDGRIAFWYRQNAFIAAAPSVELDLPGKTSIPDVVHPDLWRHVNAALWSGDASAKELLRRLPRALQRAVRRSRVALSNGGASTANGD
jgi:SAM-dependent methyltransferase